MYSAYQPKSPPHVGEQTPVTGIPITSLNHPARKVPWSTGLCGCFSDVSNCCVTCWCPCITFGQIAEIVDQGSTSCGASATIYALISCFTGCGWIYSCSYRSKMRSQYMLEESPCADCCVHCWCDSCSLCQQYRELKNRGFDVALGWQGNMQRRQNSTVPTAPVMVETGMNRYTN